MKRFSLWPVYCLLFVVCCTNKSDKAIPPDTVQNPASKPKPKFYGYPDLPKSKYEITSIGMGKLILGDSIENVIKNYPSAIDTFFIKNELKWKAAIVKPDSGGIIIAEAIDAIDITTFIHTNCKAFTTKEGIKVGEKAKDFSGDTLRAIELNNKVWIVTPNGNSLFRINLPLSLKAIQGKPKHILKEAEIVELGIYCVDC